MYEKLLEILEKERLNDDLQTLKPDFFIDLTNFVERFNRNEKTLDKNSLEGKLLNNEIKRAKKIISNLLDIRFRKILKAIIENKSISHESFTKEEKMIYDKIMDNYQFFSDLKKNILMGKTINEKNYEKDLDESRTFIRFLRDVPNIIGIDMKKYGPFKKEDVASLPVSNAELLISRKAAIKVEINGNR